MTWHLELDLNLLSASSAVTGATNGATSRLEHIGTPNPRPASPGNATEASAPAPVWWETPPGSCVVCGEVRTCGHPRWDGHSWGVCPAHAALVALAEGEPLSPAAQRRAESIARAVLREARTHPPLTWSPRARWRWWVARLALAGLERPSTETPWERNERTGDA
jgi:hypothetical protein